MAAASCIILNKQTVPPPVTTVNGTAVTLFSFVLPANTLGASDEVWIQTAFGPFPSRSTLRVSIELAQAAQVLQDNGTRLLEGHPIPASIPEKYLRCFQHPKG